MRALAIFGPGVHDKNLNLLRSAGLQVTGFDRPFEQHAADLVVVLGGDGTIHRFLPQLHCLKLPVLLVPCGSGNDLARALQLASPKIAVDVARAFVRGEARITAIDIGVIADSERQETLFCCVGGVGLDALAAEYANRMPRWLRSRGGYVLGAVRALLATPLRLQLNIRAGGLEIARDSCLFCFANTSSFGGGLYIAPDARLEDGELDCVLVDSMGSLPLLRCAPSLITRRHLELAQVSFFRAERLTIQSDPPTWVYADGEPVCQTPAEVRVIPRALRMLCGP